MGIYNTQKTLAATAAQIPDMTESIRQDFQSDGYEVSVETLANGGSDISVTKGGIFKAVLGMRSAMKITLTPRYDGVFFDTHVGIFGQQVIPTVISMFLFWPVLITQIWGMVSQSEMDERALAAAERVLENNPSGLFSSPDANQKFCPCDGNRISGEMKFCTECGTPNANTAKFCMGCGHRFE